VRLHRAVALLAVLVLGASAFATLVVQPYPSQVSAASGLHDDFTHDTSLNASLWQVSGPVGMDVGAYDIALPTNITLVPTFSSVGMGIAQANRSFEAGSIQSVESFTPPFTLTAVVEGTASNGHTFGLAIASADATSGVLVYGNVNPTNCSHLGDCGDPAVCGIPVNSSIPANQCYYGIDAKVANGTAWPHVPPLYLTPNLNVFYTLQISVDASGSAQYSISQGGQSLGQAAAQVGAGPFYVVLEQAEGAPVPGHGSNQAYWSSVSVGPLVISTTTSSSSTGTTTSTSSNTTTPVPTPGLSTTVWIIIIIVIAVLLFFILLLWYRRKGFTVTVLDSQTSSPVSRATVTADGPENLSGTTENDGRAAFGNVKEGDYSIKAIAGGYIPSTQVTIRVKKKTDYTVKLDRISPGAQGGVASNVPPEGPARELVVSAQIEPSLQTQQPQPTVPQPVQQGPAPTGAQPASVPPVSEEQELELGWGGERIRQIIKTFQAKGAISPETALTAQELGLSRLFVRIMKRRQGRTRVFIEINGRYYLDQKALKEMM
jgi:carboxypeptidase family protein